MTRLLLFAVNGDDDDELLLLFHDLTVVDMYDCFEMKTKKNLNQKVSIWFNNEFEWNGSERDRNGMEWIGTGMGMEWN